MQLQFLEFYRKFYHFLAIFRYGHGGAWRDGHGGSSCWEIDTSDTVFECCHPESRAYDAVAGTCTDPVRFEILDIFWNFLEFYHFLVIFRRGTQFSP